MSHFCRLSRTRWRGGGGFRPGGSDVIADSRSPAEMSIPETAGVMLGHYTTRQAVTEAKITPTTEVVFRWGCASDPVMEKLMTAKSHSAMERNTQARIMIDVGPRTAQP